MEIVSFTRMADGTKEDYQFLGEQEREFIDGLPARLLNSLSALGESFSGYPVSRLEHSLQSATRAHRAGESEELVVPALLHDIGDLLAPHSHSEMAASILRPYVSQKTYWIIKHHGLFQLYYYAHHLGGDRNARERFLDHPWYEDAVRFCEEYDQNCFDPDYDSESLAFFEPMVQRVFSKENTFDEERVARTGVPSG